ncbi:unnamed protein product [Prunus armeniaca]
MGDFGAKWVLVRGSPNLKNPRWVWGGDGFGLGMGDSPPTATTTGIPQNLLNGDEFEDGAGMESRDRDGIVIFGAYPTHCHP